MTKEEHLRQALPHLNGIREGVWCGEELEDGQHYWCIADGVVIADVRLCQPGMEPPINNGQPNP